MKKVIEKSVNEAFEALSNQQREVLILRYGLKNGKPQRLQQIGDVLHLTRERIRQIQNNSFKVLSKDICFKRLSRAIGILEAAIQGCGGVASEETICKICGAEKSIESGYIRLLLTCFENFKFSPQDEKLHPFWSLDKDQINDTRKITNLFHQEVKKKHSTIFSKENMKDILSSAIHKTFKTNKKKFKDCSKKEKEIMRLSKFIKKNKLDEWGYKTNPEVALLNIGGYVRLVMRRQNRPMHFREIASKIAEVKNKKTHIATCHNELVNKDDFVLVGRGMYALADAGYRSGTVADVIEKILNESGPLNRKEIIKKTKNERKVKETTITQALINRKRFIKNKDKTYSAVNVS